MWWRMSCSLLGQVDAALDAGTDRGGRTVDVMQNGGLHLDHAVDPVPVQHPKVPLLATALRIEGGPVQDDTAVVDPKDLGIEMVHLRVLVVEHAGVGHGLRVLLLGDHFGLGLLMTFGHHHVEVVRYVDPFRCELFHYLRIHALGVVQVDEPLHGQLLSFLQVLDHLGDQQLAPLQGLEITHLLDVDQVDDVLSVGHQLRDHPLK